MTSVAHESALRRPRSGGLAARRPLVRWAWRMFRREWRQQILVIALITVAVAAAVCGVTVAYNSGPLDYAEFGSGSALLEFDAADPRKLEASLAAVEERFGTTDVIAHRSLPVPGSVDTVEFRARTRADRMQGLRSAEVATRQAPARSPSPTESRRSSGSSSGRLSPSTAVAEPSSASSRTHVS